MDSSFKLSWEDPAGPSKRSPEPAKPWGVDWSCSFWFLDLTLAHIPQLETHYLFPLLSLILFPGKWLYSLLPASPPRLMLSIKDTWHILGPQDRHANKLLLVHTLPLKNTCSTCVWRRGQALVGRDKRRMITGQSPQPLLPSAIQSWPQFHILSSAKENPCS